MITGEQGARQPASPLREETDGKDPAKGTSPAVDFTRRAGTGNGADLAKDTGVAQPAGKPASRRSQDLKPASHRASPRPYNLNALVGGLVGCVHAGRE